MRHYALIVILIFFSSGVSLRGAEDTDDVKQTRSLDGYISFAWENDLYYQHDYYFTNGFQIDFFHNRLKQSPIHRLLISNGRKGDGLNWSGLQLRQEIFTPRDLAMDTVSSGDHPYSSTLTLAQVSVLNLPGRQMRIVTGLRVGVLGPASLGFKTQELAHSVSNPSRPPQGWDYQVRNDLILNYDIQVEKGFFTKGSSIFGVRGMGRLGTLHTDLEAGLWFRIDARKGYFNRFGPSGKPGFNVVFSLSANTRYVFYDATLQGGVFNKTSPYVLGPNDLLRWIGSVEGRLTFELYEHQLEAYTRFASPHFHTAEPHGWIGITYRYWF
jgi:hypothetical protein